MEIYRQSYPTVRSWLPLRQWPSELPIDGAPADVHAVVDAYSNWLGETEILMILFHGSPDGTIQEAGVAWCNKTIKQLTTVDIGPGIHFV